MTLLQKARDGRKRALASLHTRSDNGSNVVSIFDFGPAKAPEPVPAFSSIRSGGNIVRLAA